MVRASDPGRGSGVRGISEGTAMSEQPEFFTYARDEFTEEFIHPDDRSAVEEARQRRAPGSGRVPDRDAEENRNAPGRGGRGHGDNPAARLGDRKRLHR